MAKNLSKLKDHAAAAMAMARKSKLGDSRARCRKHPKHKQSPGVCALCLREKLSQLANKDYHSTAKIETTEIVEGSSSSSSVSSLSSYYSSSSASSCSSPCVRPCTLLRKSSISAMSSLFKRRSASFLSTGTSRSLADGFWSKLVMNRRGNKEIVEETLMRSASTRDHHHITAS